MEHSTEVFVGIDVAKSRNAVAVADGERGGEVRYLGKVDSSPTVMRRLVERLIAKHGQAHFCYEAGPTGYGLHRLITSMGHPCTVVAPSLVPSRSVLEFGDAGRSGMMLARQAASAMGC